MKRNQRWVVKLGSGLLANTKGAVDLKQIRQLAAQVAALKKCKIDVVLVSSGAVSSGMTALGLDRRPRERTALQACATIGQPILMKSYDAAFSKLGLTTAQILLTYWDLDSRKLYANTRATLNFLIGLQTCVPIVNENDALSFEEIEMLNRFGDNDRLSAQVALLAEADQLIILSGIDGLYSNPDATGELIRHVQEVDARIEACAGSTNSERSVGGMISKLETAKMMLEANIPMVLANGRAPGVLTDLMAGKEVGTRFDKARRRR